jgi:hypothetical protein
VSHRTRRAVSEAARKQHHQRHRRRFLEKRLKHQLKPHISPMTDRIAAQIAAHAEFDRLWCGPAAVMVRNQAYQYLQKITGLSEADAHIRRLNPDECYGLIEKVHEDFPQVFPKSA